MITVYIADDEMWGTLGLKKLLERSGYELKVIGTADNGLTAKEEIEKLKPDVVFADIRMPGLSGLELLEVIPKVQSFPMRRQRYNSMHLIFCLSRSRNWS